MRCPSGSLIFGLATFASGLLFHVYVDSILKKIKKENPELYRGLLGGKKDVWIDRLGYPL